MQTEDSAVVRVVGWRHLMVGAVVASLIFLSLVSAVAGGSRVDLLAVAALASFLVGLAVAFAAAVLGLYRARIGRAGDLYRAAERIVLRNRDFLFDNPRVSVQPLIRRALLPTDAELAALGLHPTVTKTLREFREGRHWFMGGGVRGGVRYTIEPESSALASYKTQVEALLRVASVRAGGDTGNNEGEAS